MPEEPLILKPDMFIPIVGNLQEQLNSVANYGLAVDNYYGPLTASAVRDFQAMSGLPQTGVVDPATWRRLFNGNPLPSDTVAPSSQAPVTVQQAGGNEIRINLGERLLRFYKNGNLAGTFPIAIGKPATPTPVGTFYIRNKAFNPGGPFGTRWLGVTKDGVGIHGTNMPSSIGLAVSSGCIRMYNADVETIYPQLNVGDKVTIVAGSAAAGAGFDYTVKPGDALFPLAQRFNTTVSAIRVANGLNTNEITVGQVLYIPGPITGGPTSNYTVLPGDTLFNISQRFGTTVGAIQYANGLTTEIIYSGQVLKIPNVPFTPPPLPETPPSPPPGTTTYTVQPGDTLYLIAQTFGTTLDQLRTLNNLTGDLIHTGQVLIVPADAPPDAGNPPAGTFQTYVVQPGDTLYSVAERFHTTITELVRINALTTSRLHAGQVLKVP